MLMLMTHNRNKGEFFNNLICSTKISEQANPTLMKLKHSNKKANIISSVNFRDIFRKC